MEKENNQNQVNISDLSLIEIKAIAYDLLIQLQQIQSNLQMINQEIIKKSNKQ